MLLLRRSGPSFVKKTILYILTQLQFCCVCTYQCLNTFCNIHYTDGFCLTSRLLWRLLNHVNSRLLERCQMHGSTTLIHEYKAFLHVQSDLSTCKHRNKFVGDKLVYMYQLHGRRTILSKPLMFSVSSFALSSVPNVFILKTCACCRQNFVIKSQTVRNFETTCNLRVCVRLGNLSVLWRTLFCRRCSFKSQVTAANLRRRKRT
jgi:hypothetical protein